VGLARIAEYNMHIRILPMTRTTEDVALKVRRYRLFIRKPEGATELEVRLSTVDLARTCSIEELAALLEARPFTDLQRMTQVVAEAGTSFDIKNLDSELTVSGRPGFVAAVAPE
jgi:hypothetical protein